MLAGAAAAAQTPQRDRLERNVAEALGLLTPSSLLVPHAYVSALRLLNGRQD